MHVLGCDRTAQISILIGFTPLLLSISAQTSDRQPCWRSCHHGEIQKDDLASFPISCSRFCHLWFSGIAEQYPGVNSDPSLLQWTARSISDACANSRYGEITAQILAKNRKCPTLKALIFKLILMSRISLQDFFVMLQP
jgi:hypothetical protein